jgi:N-acetyl-anhydromuramyl-L-alanine amidase AmpD
MAIWKPAAQGNFEVGRRRSIDRITFHHIAGDAPGAIARFQTTGVQVSAHYIIGSDGVLYQCVEEKNTAYCDANSDSNARTISIEHAGGIASVPYTEKMYATAIALVRDLIARYGIKDFQRHRDVSDTPTACPGQLDVERIVKAAQGGEMYDGKSAEEWAKAAAFATSVAESRAKLLAEVGLAAGVNPDNPIEQDDVNQMIANIASKNEEIARLKQTSGGSSSQDAVEAAKYRTIKEALK